MARTINKWVTPETGGLEMLDSTTSISVAGSAGSRYFDVNGNFEVNGFDYISDAGDLEAVGFDILFDRASGSATIFPFNHKEVSDANASIGVRAVIDKTAGTAILNLRDAAGSNLTGTATLNLGQFYNLALVWQDLDSGTAELFVDNVSQISETAQDFNRGAAPDKYTWFGNATDDVHVKNIWIASGLTAVSDRIVAGEVFAYQNSKASVTPDAGLGGNAATDGDSNNWSVLGETPGSDAAAFTYDGTAEHGVVSLAAFGAEIDGDASILGMAGIWRAEYTGGGSQSHFLGLGDSGDGDSAARASVTLTSTPTEYFQYRTTDLPTSAQTIRQGFSNEGGRNLDAYEMWAIILHEPDTTVMVDLALGTYTLAGPAISIIVDREVNLALGTYALVGNAIDITITVEVNLDLGTYSLVGNDITFLIDKEVNLNTGTYTLAGNDITFLINKAVNLDTGTYSLVGNDITFLVNQVVNLDLGTYSLVGNDITFLIDKEVNLNTGTYTLAGPDIDITFETIVNLDLGTYALAGSDITFLIDREVNLDTGTYTLAGNTIEILVNKVVNLDAGIYTLTGPDISILVNQVVNLDLGTYVLAGNDIEILVDKNFNLDLGTYTLVGNAIDIVTGLNVNLDTITYTLSGNDIDIVTPDGGLDSLHRRSRVWRSIFNQ